MNKLIGIICLSVLIITGTLSAEEKVTPVIDKTIETGDDRVVMDIKIIKETALAKSPSIEAAVLRLEQSFERTKQAKAEKYPSLDIQSQWNNNVYSNNGFSDREDSIYTSDLIVSWNLFSGFKTKYSILSSEYSEKISIETEREIKNLLLWMVSSSYYRVQNAHESIDIAESDIHYNMRLLEDAQAKEAIGAGSYSDVLNFETRINQARSNVIAAEYDYRTELTNLAGLMGLPGSDFPGHVKLSRLDEYIFQENQTIDIETKMIIALDKRPDILQKRYDINKSSADINIAASGFYPSVNLNGTVGSSGTNDNFTDTDVISGSVMLNINFNLFSGGSTKAKVQEEKLKKKEKEKILEDLKLTLYTELRTVSEEIRSAASYLKLQEENRILVKKMRDLVEKEYQAGKTSLVRLNETQNDLVSTESNYAMARVAYLQSLEKLEYYTGEIGDNYLNTSVLHDN